MGAIGQGCLAALTAAVLGGFCGPAWAGEVYGAVTEPDGSPHVGAPVNLAGKTMGLQFTTKTNADGDYVIADVPPGEYTLTIVQPCCTFSPVQEQGLQVGDERLRFDIALKQGIALDTFGDDPATVAAQLRGSAEQLSGRAPQTPDGHPDLSGVWLPGADPYPTDPELTDWAKSVVAKRAEKDFFEHPHTSCLPAGPPLPAGGSPFIAKLVQTPRLVLILLEDYPGFRQIFTDGRGHPEDPNPAWMGHSIGRWEDDTLVVDTIGFNDRVWLDRGIPATESLHMQERYRRTSVGRIELQVTFTDPAVFIEPWIQNMPLDLAPDAELIEYVCENNKWAPTSVQ